MRVRWFRSATVGVESRSGTKILCDPWFTDGAFVGSWFHWPPLEGFEYAEALDIPWDAVYISHLHPDHFDRRFVAALARRQPACVALVPHFASSWLRRAVQSCGFGEDRTIVLPSGSRTQLGDIEVQVFTADHCNPLLCGVSTPCHDTAPQLASIDSLALFRGDGQAILNANDALAVASVARLLPRFGKVDVLLGHFGGAGPYPQCFPQYSSEDKKCRARDLARTFVSRLAAAANAVGARYVFPYAGQYVLGGRLTGLNDYRAVLPLDDVITELNQSTAAMPVTLEPMGILDLDRGGVSGPWREPAPSILEKYLERIARESFPYERQDDVWPSMEPSMLAAGDSVKRAFEVSPEGMSATADCSIVMADRDGRAVTFDFLGGAMYSRLGVDPASHNVTTIVADPSLWRRLVVRRPGYTGFTQFHFNQAEIGSHLEWFRQGEYRAETRFLNFLRTSSS